MNSFLWALAAAGAWGLAAFFEKLGLLRGDPLSGVCARCAGVALGGLALAAFIPGLGGRISDMGWKSFALVAFGGFLASVVGQVFFYRGLKFGEIGRVSSVAGSWPVLAFLLGMVFLGDAPTPKKFLGVALVVMGVSLLK